MEAESRSKAESIKQKKKLEGDVTELEVALDHAGKSNGDLQKSNKKLQQSVSELQSALDNEERVKAELREATLLSERRGQNLLGEIEDLRASLEVAERARKAAENDLNDAADRISELNSASSGLAAHKRKLEGDNAALRAELDDACIESKLQQDILAKALNDVARQAEEIRNEQEHSANAEKLRKGLETQVKDLQTRLDQAESNALKGGKRFMQKLEQRVNIYSPDIYVLKINILLCLRLENWNLNWTWNRDTTRKHSRKSKNTTESSRSSHFKPRRTERARTASSS